MKQSTNDSILEVKDITKKFPGVTALNKVSMELWKGKVTAVIGENGAGKSTLMKVLSGIYQDFEGEIYLEQQPMTIWRLLAAHTEPTTSVFRRVTLVQRGVARAKPGA